MQIDIITIFPHMFQGPLDASIVRRGARVGCGGDRRARSARLDPTTGIGRWTTPPTAAGRGW